MARCENCQRELSGGDVNLGIVCANCGHRSPPARRQAELNRESKQGSQDWAAIARIRNLAEVGYFCDVLDAANIETRVHEFDEFDAVSGTWDRLFVIQVATGHAELATEILNAELEGAEGRAYEERPYEDDRARGVPVQIEPRSNIAADRFNFGDEPSGRANWLPVALALMAGGVATWIARDLAERRPVAQTFDRKGALWQAIEESDHLPWEGETRAGQPSRRMRTDPKRHAIVFEEDFNGDGFFDRKRLFFHDGSIGEVK